ncbi:hypothetical protein [Niveibacterium sp. SC-1]|uniref:DUF7079 family protein n=1 Tax=Niveibacterium sp. SC-1 TaxID=3135646 RepID=UPI00311D476C
MLSPEADLADRIPVWDAMQMFWMDTDPAGELDFVLRVCARSKYSIEELKRIYWNEVRPAVAANLWAMPAPEWAGFRRDYLVERVMRKHRYGRRLPWAWLHPHATWWWRELEAGLRRHLPKPRPEPRE